MFKGAFVVLLMLGIATIVWGQSSADLSAKYRQITSYELRPDVVMTPKYAADGQVCQMVLEKRQKTDTGMVFGVSFSEKEVKGLVDELVPEGERGRDLTKPLNTTVDGGFITTEYNYENVHVRVYGITRPAPAGDRVITITWPKRTCSGEQNSATAETVDPKTGRVAHTTRCSLCGAFENPDPRTSLNFWLRCRWQHDLEWSGGIHRGVRLLPVRRRDGHHQH